MKVLSPVVWSEGMHVAQHHFQAQTRYFEELTAFVVGNLFFGAYGLIRCELDAEALVNGTVVLQHARGIMPDGLTFNFPEDPAPAPLSIAGLFSPIQDSHRVLLAISPHRADRANCAVGGNGDQNLVRYVSSEQNVLDEVTGFHETRVNVARKNFRLLLDIEETGDLVTMPVARVRRDGRGHFVYDPEYIPPCLQLAASPRLIDLTARMVEMLDARSTAILRERAASKRPLAEAAAAEVANFWFTHSLNSASAPLRHLWRTRVAHPERLYTELARLAGSLCTFSLEDHPRDLPVYDHDDLGPCFDALERHIRRNLDYFQPPNAVVVPLAAADHQYFYRAAVSDKRCLLPSTHWYLGIRSAGSRVESMNAVPRLVKICSAEHIVRLVTEGLPGLAMEYEPTPPPTMSPRLGWNYFRVQASGPCWTSIVKTGHVGVYAPAAIPDPEMEFSIVIGS
jgi:type VI secretion system protein ImpJ